MQGQPSPGLSGHRGTSQTTNMGGQQGREVSSDGPGASTSMVGLHGQGQAAEVVARPCSTHLSRAGGGREVQGPEVTGGGEGGGDGTSAVDDDGGGSAARSVCARLFEMANELLQDLENYQGDDVDEVLCVWCGSGGGYVLVCAVAPGLYSRRRACEGQVVVWQHFLCGD